MEFVTDLQTGLPSPLQAAQVALRLIAGAVLGGIIGLQRELSGKAAGLRTHMLVSLGTAFFVLIPLEIGMEVADFSRVIQGIATGIGFIGAGAILKLRREHDIRGLTTAASLWVSAAVGVACGTGRIVSAAICVLITWLILAGLSRVSEKISGDEHDTE